MSMNLYDLLGVQQNATADEIKKAYRKIAKEKHPDISKEPNAAEEFPKYVEAYDILSNPELRKLYDEELSGADAHELRFDKAFMDIMENLIKRRKGYSSPIKGRSYEVPLAVTVEELLSEREKEVTITMKHLCGTCTGSGEVRSEAPCKACSGKGGHSKSLSTPFGKIDQRVPCRVCLGSGKENVEACPTCKGEKQLVLEKKIPVSLHRNLNFGDTIVIAGAGAPGLSGGTDGDVTFVLQQDKNDRFSVFYDTDVEKIEYVTLEDMLLGNTISLTLPSGKVKNVTLSEHFRNPNNKVIFAEEGLFKNGKRGQYSVRLIVDFSVIDKNLHDRLVECLRVSV